MLSYNLASNVTDKFGVLICEGKSANNNNNRSRFYYIVEVLKLWFFCFMKEFRFRYIFPYRTERSLVIQGRHLYSPRTKYNIMYSIIDLEAHDLYYTQAYIRNIIVVKI